jgi:CBS domain-containing protein
LCGPRFDKWRPAFQAYCFTIEEAAMSVAEILRTKGSRVITVRPDSTLHEAIRTLVNSGVGALVVVDGGGRVVGMLTERDILRENARHFDQLGDRRVSEIMTEDVIIGLLDDDLEYVMTLMTEKRIRHLPVMEKGQLAGIVSIGDLVKAKARQAEIEIRHLTDYIMGKYPG